MEKGRVETYLLEKLEEEGSVHLPLLDPEKTSATDAVEVVQQLEQLGSAALMVGGSTLADQTTIDKFVKQIHHETSLPVILFPNNASVVVSSVDAIWFMSLLNSRNPYYITRAQMLGAPRVKNYDVEPLPLGYIVVGEGGTVSLIGEVEPIPYERQDLVAAYALAAKYLGMRFVYLESGSGAREPAPASVIRLVKSEVSDMVTVVGGGIRTGDQAYSAARAGAQIVVTGTLLEEEKLSRERMKELVQGVRDGGRDRLSRQ